MVNVPKLKGKLEALHSYQLDLHKLAEFSRDDFTADFMKINSAKYLLQVSVECCLDIGTHVIASEHFKTADTYSEIFPILAQNNVITEEFAQRLVRMARFRNRLVHLYWEVENEMIYDILQNNLTDFKEFSSAIASLIAKG